MTSNLKDNVEELVDISIDKEENQFKKIRKMHKDIYLSNHSEITQSSSRNLVHMNIFNMYKNKNEIIISVGLEKEMEYKYVLMVPGKINTLLDNSKQSCSVPFTFTLHGLTK